MRLPKPPREPQYPSSARDEERHDKYRGRTEKQQGHHDGRDDTSRSKAGQSRGSCNDRPFSWPTRHDDDDDEDYHHPGQGDAKFSEGYWGVGEVRRERTRSPPRRNYGDHKGRHIDLGNRTGAGAAGVRLDVLMPATQNLSKEQLQALFAVRAHRLKTDLHNKVLSSTPSADPSTVQVNKEAWLEEAEAYVTKATHLATMLGIEAAAAGEQAWSETIPVKHAFDRLWTSLRLNTENATPTINGVVVSLGAMGIDPGHAPLGGFKPGRGCDDTLEAAGGNIDAWGASGDSDGVTHTQQVTNTDDGGMNVGETESANMEPTEAYKEDDDKRGTDDATIELLQSPATSENHAGDANSTTVDSNAGQDAPANRADRSGMDDTSTMLLQLPAGAENHAGDDNTTTDSNDDHDIPATMTGNEANGNAKHGSGVLTAGCGSANQPDGSGNAGDICDAFDTANELGISSLFSTPPPPIISLPSQRRQRRQRNLIPENFVARRSVRLSTKPSMPAEEKAQRNLCRKLGITSADSAPIEDVLRDFTNTFKGEMPQSIKAAMATIFDLENEATEAIDEALLAYAGQDFSELQIYNDE
nr:unnamed protein product [Digitaria exilis]